TERARNLREQYALQAADLRARIERRINRVPVALRQVTMGELVARHAQLRQQQSQRLAASLSSRVPVQQTRQISSQHTTQQIQDAMHKTSRANQHATHHYLRGPAPSPGSAALLSRSFARGAEGAAAAAQVRAVSGSGMARTPSASVRKVSRRQQLSPEKAALGPRGAAARDHADGANPSRVVKHKKGNK
ncbi:hypothetical protein KEM52_001246, partial [Ascosphaera acerosa]